MQFQSLHYAKQAALKDHASIWPLEIKKPYRMTEQLQIVKICSLNWYLREKKLQQALTYKSYDHLGIYVKQLKS